PVERAIRSTLRDLDPLLPVESITTMDAVVASNIAEPLFQTRLLIAFAVLAIGLAAVGIYGVLAYAVAERRHEIGVRLALGATGGRVSWLIMSRTLGIAVPGVALGLAAAWLASRVMGTLLFEVSPHDTATFAIVPLVLIA